MTTPADIATKQIKLHGQDCVCDFCEVSRALLKSGGGNLTAAETKAMISLKVDLKQQKEINQLLIREQKFYQDDLRKNSESIKALGEQIQDLTERLVVANHKLNRQQEGSPEEALKKMTYYKDMAEEWRRKAMILQEEINQFDPIARWDNPFYDPEGGWHREKIMKKMKKGLM